ncbi:signal peptidase I [Natronosalvus amylolyticus]|uniref:signal peptidase I n=1 Tax=Natronosalvus amylolyticus TaxID=2961994 RepID=UPI0020C9EAF0|nr:signal peptidase I [Natronosalvus amylolyticus]
MSFKRIVNVLGLLLLIAIVVPFAIYGAPWVIGGEYSFVVLTGSMAPAIEPGDVVIVGETDPGSIGDGDVITFLRGDAEAPVTHRVTDVYESDAGIAFETKGDANNEVDASLVPAENVLGVVILSIPYIGYVIQATNTPVGFAVVVLLPVALFVGSELWRLFKAARGSKVAHAAHTDVASVAEPDASPSGEAETIPTGETETTPPKDADAQINGGEESLAEVVAERPTNAEVLDGDEPVTSLEDEAAVEPEPASSANGVSITAADLTLSTGLLILVAPYAIYVALELRTGLAFSVAFGATFSLLAVGALQVGAWYGASRGATDTEPGDGSDDQISDHSTDRTELESTTADGSHRVDRSGAIDDAFDEFEPASVRPVPETDGGDEVIDR